MPQRSRLWCQELNSLRAYLQAHFFHHRGSSLSLLYSSPVNRMCFQGVIYEHLWEFQQWVQSAEETMSHGSAALYKQSSQSLIIVFKNKLWVRVSDLQM